jgi:hypothetical protein
MDLIKDSSLEFVIYLRLKRDFLACIFLRIGYTVIVPGEVSTNSLPFFIIMLH